ncbi:MAG TPA: hypothetical protein VN780_11680 [Candidatus Eisenbacteria bacterium]|nr:hypothetical protein [Candidatus Eisenbacteria bacterium]
MPFSRVPPSHERIEFKENLTLADIHQLSLEPELRILQCSSPVAPKTWDLINEELLPCRTDIEIRAYGFYSSVCDLSFVARMRNVRHFAADCLRVAINVGCLAALENLESLSVGIHNLQNFDFLAEIPSGITHLSLVATKSKKPQLNLLARFRCLKTLYLEAQQNEIEALSELSMLEDLTLRSISTSGLGFLAGLDHLWSLDVKLGGIRDLSEIQGKQSIKYLELWQILGLRDVTVVSTLCNLQYLYLQSLRNVIAIPDLSKLRKLRRLYLENMKALADVSAVLRSPSLQEFIHISAQNVRPAQYEDLPGIKTLRNVLVGFGSRKKNQQFEALLRQSGIELFQGSEFVFE